jgi:hypothetical protein
MSAAYCLFVAALAGPAPELPASRPFSEISTARAAVTQALYDSNRARGRDPMETAPPVVSLYERLSQSDELPTPERRRLQSQLRTRLVELNDVLRRRALRAAATNSGGGPVAARAQELIDLIQSTIAPESWAVNGGRGTIVFYSPLNVLVIRQTAEVHHQIGGTINQLRP